MKEIVLKENKLIDELAHIRNTMNTDIKKAKQKLTNLIHNLRDRKGKCFKLVD